MTLQPHTRIAHYEIVGTLGAGGMGEVLRARDTRLNRDVAIKILPRIFADDAERLARFEREAQTLAALNHPHIAQIHGVEETPTDGGRVRALVMEFVDGEDLSARIARGPVPLDEALPIARQIAEALEAAHEQGIVHRDLKPANIKVRPDGTVKVLDFGLAKAADPAPADPALSPTFTSPVTQMGVILGTAAYMAPEQAKGKPVDRRADIWAFGVVLYEMLTGRPLFAAESVAETIGLVVTRDPDLSALPAGTPPRVREMLRRCLERDPKQRLRDAGEARIVLSAPAADLPAAARDAARPRTPLLATAAALLFAAVAGVVVWHLKPSAAVPVRRLELPPVIAEAGAFALSPDGRSIAYTSEGHLYVRHLDSIEPRDLGEYPPGGQRLFWSPDSRTIGFIAQASIRTIPAAGGPVFIVCRLPFARTVFDVAWRNDSTIVFSMGRDSLYVVPASGGTPQVLVAVDVQTEVDFHWFAALPDGRLVIATHRRNEDVDRIELLDGGRRQVISTEGDFRAFRYVEPSTLLALRAGQNPGVWAIPFTGGPLDLSKATLVEAAATSFDVSDEGTLVARLQPPIQSSLVWVTRGGAATPVPGPAIAGLTPQLALSPDGSRATYVAGARDTLNLFVRHLTTGTDTRLRQDDASEGTPTWNEVRNPSWLPAGDRILYADGPIEGQRIRIRRSDGAGGESELTPGFLARVSADGATLVWITDERGRGRLRYAPFGADGRAGEAKNVFSSAEPDVRDFDLSPDGRAIAYVARQADTRQAVYVSDFPAATGRWEVTAGGNRPRFSHDGRELFFTEGSRTDRGARTGHLMAIPIATLAAVKLGIASRLLEEASGGPDLASYAVARDGRFLMSRRVATPAGSSRAVLVQNWPAAIERK